ncbi:MalY/PatB family protein [Paenibacillus sp. NPDC057967]|uniref:MalY/PatB family protein n=1 Tax=Paenibacillus sp. NPDC057967 TaxID=3346293 RepID=UPI0036D9A162
MKYNFDEIIRRTGTNAVKWEPEKLKSLTGSEPEEDIIPMWVADMDFRSPQPVVDALLKRAEHGIFGYCMPHDSYYDALKWWLKERHDWEIRKEWVRLMPGIVPSLGFLIRALSEEGDHVIIQQPVYHPFRRMAEKNNRVIMNNALRLEEGVYRIDLEDFEQKATNPKTKLFILSNPHNPVGRVWHEDELRALGEICIRHGVIVISDEIHQDFILNGSHTVYARLGEAFANNSVICTAPSKTFNLSGLSTSNIIIPNLEIKQKLEDELQKSHIGMINLFGIVALTAAYSEGGAEWLEQLIEYLRGNLAYMDSFIRENMPKVKLIQPEATYVAWLDFREVTANHEDLVCKMKESNVLLNEGTMFGDEGAGFMRINFAAPRSVLKTALERIAQVLS